MKKHSGLILSCVIFGLISMVSLTWAGVPSALTDFQSSNKVEVVYANGTNTQTYGMVAKHSAGDRVFGTTDSSNIYYQSNDTWKGMTITQTSVTTPTGGLSADSMTGTWGGTAL